MILNVMLFIIEFKSKRDNFRTARNTPTGVIQKPPRGARLSAPIRRGFAAPPFHGI
jgi:hypothetical protein